MCSDVAQHCSGTRTFCKQAPALDRMGPLSRPACCSAETSTTCCPSATPMAGRPAASDVLPQRRNTPQGRLLRPKPQDTGASTSAIATAEWSDFRASKPAANLFGVRYLCGLGALAGHAACRINGLNSTALPSTRWHTSQPAADVAPSGGRPSHLVHMRAAPEHREHQCACPPTCSASSLAVVASSNRRRQRQLPPAHQASRLRCSSCSKTKPSPSSLPTRSFAEGQTMTCGEPTGGCGAYT